MTEIEARGYIQGKLNCMNKCGVFEQEDSENKDLCDNCEYCYSQGNFGKQKEAFEFAIQALEKQEKIKEVIKNANQWSKGDSIVRAQAFCLIDMILKESEKNNKRRQN